MAQLDARYAIPSAEWREIVGRVQRHRFVPSWYDWQGDEEPKEYVGSDDVERWMAKVYADDVVPIDPRDEHCSASSQPSMMLAFIGALDLGTNHRVMEIGTGSGYNAALLCERVGSSNVTTIDLEPQLVESSAARLAACGYTPTVAVADGVQGYPATAPYDRIIATCAVHRIPDAWLHQLAPDGVLVTPLAGGRFEYGLVQLRKRPDGTADGRLRFQGASFMPLRQPGRQLPPEASEAEALLKARGGRANATVRAPRRARLSQHRDLGPYVPDRRRGAGPRVAMAWSVTRVGRAQQRAATGVAGLGLLARPVLGDRVARRRRRVHRDRGVDRVASGTLWRAALHSSTTRASPLMRGTGSPSRATGASCLARLPRFRPRLGVVGETSTLQRLVKGTACRSRQGGDDQRSRLPIIFAGRRR